jgi:hypothetical protein
MWSSFVDQSTLCKKGSFLEENEGVDTARGQRPGVVGWKIIISHGCPLLALQLVLKSHCVF